MNPRASVIMVHAPLLELKAFSSTEIRIAALLCEGFVRLSFFVEGRSKLLRLVLLTDCHRGRRRWHWNGGQSRRTRTAEWIRLLSSQPSTQPFWSIQTPIAFNVFLLWTP